MPIPVSADGNASTRWPMERRREMALIGVIAAALRVSETAESTNVTVAATQLDEQLLAAAVNRHPDSWEQLFPQPSVYQPAVIAGIRLFSGGSTDRAVLLYSMQLVALAERLGQQPAIRNALADLLDECTAPEPAQLATIYQATISKLGQRIQVTGAPAILQREQSAELIRALLLAGVRFAWLWRSLGGRRHHLILRRRKLLQSLRMIREQI